MDFFHGNKINRIRSFALILIFLGLILMYGGILFKQLIIISMIFIILGCLSIILSTIIYLWIGLLSTQTQSITCSNCKRNTKILGSADLCMHCNQPITYNKD